MIIKKIRSINFQSYQSASVELSDAPLCIVGRNMSGKSSLARMIDWALTGSFGYPNLSKYTKDLVRPFGASKDPTIVELTVAVGGKDYVATRILDKKETVYIKTPEGVRLKDEEAEELILTLAKIPKTGTIAERKNLFSRTFWFGVGQQTSFYNAKASERKDILESINPFTRLPKMEELTARKVKELDIILQDEEKALFKEEATLSVKLQDIEKLVGGESGAASLLNEEVPAEIEAKLIDELQSKITIAESAIRKKPLLEKEMSSLIIEDFTDRLAEAKEKEDELKKRLADLKEKEALERTIRAELLHLKSRSDEAEKRLNADRQRLQLISDAFRLAKEFDVESTDKDKEDTASERFIKEYKPAEGLKKALALSRNALKDSIKQDEAIAENLTTISSSLAGKKKELELTKEKILKLIDTVEGKSDGDICDHCGSKLSKETAEAHLLELSDNMDRLESEVSDMSAANKALSSNKKIVSELIERFTKTSSKEEAELGALNRLASEVVSTFAYTKRLLDKSINECLEIIGDTKRQAEEKEKELGPGIPIKVDVSDITRATSEVKLLEQLNEKNKEAAVKKEMLTKELEALSVYNKEDLEKEKKELERLKELKRSSEEKKRIRADVERLMNDVKEVRSRLQSVSGKVKEDQRRRKVLGVIKGLLSPNGDARTIALANDVSNVVAMTNNSLREMELNRSLAIDLKLKKEKDGTPTIDLSVEVDGESGKVTPSNSQLKIIGMAMDLAVAKLGGRSGFIIVDEPEEGMDEINRAKVSRFLKKASDQTILVTNSAAAGFENIVTTEQARMTKLEKADFDLPKIKSSKITGKKERTDAVEAVDEGEL